MELAKYLSAVKKRPGMYIADDGMCLQNLENQLFGYEAAIKLHSIPNDMVDFNTGLSEFINKELQWSSSCGWAEAISSNTVNSTEALRMFFEISNQYIERIYGIKNAIDETIVK